MAEVQDAEKTMIRNLEEKTGKSFDQWMKTAKAAVDSAACRMN